MLKIKILSLGILSILCFSVGVYAEDKPVAELRVFLASSQTLTANFKQILIDEEGRAAQTSYGLFYLRRPGKFRWDYIKPFAQQIVSSSGKVWFYDEDLEQVTIKKIDQSIGSTPALLLSGDIALEDNFLIEKQGVDGDLFWIKLLPKNEDSGFKYVLIGLDSGKLAGMELSDNFGQLTRIYFTNVKMNVAIDEKRFEFKAPAGVDVFEE